MTYRDDPNNPNRSSYPMTPGADYTGWIVGGIVALVVIIGLFAMMSGTDQTGTAANPPPTTTGSATSTPANPPAPQNTLPSTLPR